PPHPTEYDAPKPVPYTLRYTVPSALRSTGTPVHDPVDEHSKSGTGVSVPSLRTRTAVAAGGPCPVSSAVKKPAASACTSVDRACSTSGALPLSTLMMA